MAIDNKTRKKLWAKSGNKCAFCKAELITSKDNIGDFNIGEECHIISGKSKGPRFKDNIDNYDLYDNLILLCRNHHREIDELTETFSEEVLRYVKINHENWVTNSLNKNIGTKKEKPKFLLRITSGKELLNIISDTHGYQADYDNIDNKKDAEYIGSVVQSLVDYGDINSVLEPYDRIQICFELNEMLKEFENKGYFLFGEKSIKRIKFEDGTKDNLTITAFAIKKKEDINIIKKEF